MTVKEQIIISININTHSIAATKRSDTVYKCLDWYLSKSDPILSSFRLRRTKEKSRDRKTCKCPLPRMSAVQGLCKYRVWLRVQTEFGAGRRY